MTTAHTFPQVLWREFGSALTMMQSAITACPPQVWCAVVGPHEFWYIAYHTLFWTDYYGSETTDDFRPPAPYTLGELDPAGALPDRVYGQEELLSYLDHVMRKNRALIRRLPTLSGEPQDLHLHHRVMYNTRHLQHHAGQLHMLLRQRVDDTPGWANRPTWELEG